ncbi:hypothetical protein MP228_002572 [Amoeboaphelidium protococcarum]|nr:hypothetical protein MP228_002572 [Amoeboaphelidium protococcarum]
MARACFETSCKMSARSRTRWLTFVVGPPLLLKKRMASISSPSTRNGCIQVAAPNLKPADLATSLITIAAKIQVVGDLDSLQQQACLGVVSLKVYTHYLTSMPCFFEATKDVNYAAGVETQTLKASVFTLRTAAMAQDGILIQDVDLALKQDIKLLESLQLVEVICS